MSDTLHQPVLPGIEPETPELPAAPEAKPSSHKGLAIILAIVGGLVLLSVVMAATTHKSTPVPQTVAPAAAPATSTLTAADVADIIWTPNFCVVATQGLNSGLTYGSEEAAFLSGFNDPVNGWVSQYPGVSGSVVFADMWTTCVDEGY